VDVRLVPFDALASATPAGLDARMVCLSYMNPDSLAHARYLVRRLRRRTDAPIFVGFWSVEAEEAQRQDLAAVTRADLAATSLEEAVERILEAVRDTAEASVALPAEAQPSRSLAAP
jgi:hypothetical protein